MAQHDYVIANGTGAAVRSDLNNALAAIVSQNSGATAPSTTYAYMPWADTTTGLFKIRNAANNGWITLYELDGTFSIEAGSASSPGLYFTGDSNTGIYSPGADQFGISTGGTGRLVIDSSGNVNIDSGTLYVDASNNRVGIGTASPVSPLMIGTAGGVANGISLSGGSSTNDSQNLRFGFVFGGNYEPTAAITGVLTGGGPTQGALTFSTVTSGSLTEKARIDSSGRLLVGTSTHSGLNVGGFAGLNTYIANTGDTGISISKFSNDAAGPSIQLIKSRGTSVGSNVLVSSGDSFGQLVFGGADGNGFIRGAASIDAVADTTTGAGDMPGRLVFSTTADGASSSTERMRITSTGQVRLAGAGITFNGDTATANELDDYEEGAWTPGIANGYNQGAVVTYTSQVGSYTKIGRVVIAAFHLEIASISSGGGPLFFSGLPFTPASTTDSRFQAAIQISGVNTPSSPVNVLLGYAKLDNASYYLTFNCPADDTAMANARCITNTSNDWAAGDTVGGTFTYFV